MTFESWILVIEIIGYIILIFFVISFMVVMFILMYDYVVMPIKNLIKGIDIRLKNKVSDIKMNCEHDYVDKKRLFSRKFYKKCKICNNMIKV